MFKNKNLSVLYYANGFTGWHYKSDESLDVVKRDGFFDMVYTLMNWGDTIVVVTPDTTDILYVSEIDGSTVKTKRIGE